MYFDNSKTLEENIEINVNKRLKSLGVDSTEDVIIDIKDVEIEMSKKLTVIRYGAIWFRIDTSAAYGFRNMVKSGSLKLSDMKILEAFSIRNNSHKLINSNISQIININSYL